MWRGGRGRGRLRRRRRMLEVGFITHHTILSSIVLACENNEL